MSRFGILRTAKTVVIEENESLSGAVNCEGSSLAAVILPPDWTTADITFQASADGTNWFNVFDAAENEVTILQATANVDGEGAYLGQYTALDPTLFRGVGRLKVRSGTSGTPVTQTGANKTVTLVFIND